MTKTDDQGKLVEKRGISETVVNHLIYEAYFISKHLMECASPIGHTILPPPTPSSVSFSNTEL